MASKVNVTTAGEPRPLIAIFPNVSTLHKHGQRSSSFPEIHRACNVGILCCLNFNNMLDVVIFRINFNTKQYDKCKLVLKFNHLVTIAKLFNKEVVH